MAIPTGGSKRKGDPVEKPKAKAKGKATNSQFKSFPNKQKFDNQAIRGAAPNVLEGSMKALNKKRAERSTDTDYAPHMKPIQPKPRRESMLVPHPKGKAKADPVSVAGHLTGAAVTLVNAAINPGVSAVVAGGYIARQAVGRVLENRKQKKDAADRKKPRKRKMRPPTIGPTKGKKE